MANSYSAYIEDVGIVVFKKRKRTRRLSLSSGSAGALKITVPYWVSFKEAKRMVSSEVKWVKRYLSRMAKWKMEHAELPLNSETLSLASGSERLKERTKVLAQRNGFEVNNIIIREQKSRWGSCSHNNNISLNRKLNKLPNKFVDYVILHELVHTRIKNHGKGFWLEIERYSRSARECDRELRKYNIAFL